MSAPARPAPAHPAQPVHVGTDAAKVRVVVTDALGLQRVLTMLTGRGHAFLRLEAEEAAGGRWTISVDVMAASTRLDLVAARLHRLPSVLSVDVTTAGLAPSA